MSDESKESLKRISTYLQGDLNEAEGAWFLDKNALNLALDRVKELERERDGLREKVGNLNTAREQLSAYNTRRFEAAKSAMQGMLSNDFKYEESISAKAVEYADALLAALETKR